jgi:predicted membrane GTPase involved in stress response
MEKIGTRRAEMLEMKNPGQGMVRLMYRIPARGLFGYRSEFMTDTRGTGIMHHRFLDYGPWAGPLAGRLRGSLVSMENGVIVAFALWFYAGWALWGLLATVLGQETLFGPVVGVALGLLMVTPLARSMSRS